MGSIDSGLGLLNVDSVVDLIHSCVPTGEFTSFFDSVVGSSTLLAVNDFMGVLFNSDVVLKADYFNCAVFLLFNGELITSDLMIEGRLKYDAAEIESLVYDRILDLDGRSMTKTYRVSDLILNCYWGINVDMIMYMDKYTIVGVFEDVLSVVDDGSIVDFYEVLRSNGMVDEETNYTVVDPITKKDVVYNYHADDLLFIRVNDQPSLCDRYLDLFSFILNNDVYYDDNIPVGFSKYNQQVIDFVKGNKEKLCSLFINMYDILNTRLITYRSDEIKK